MSFIDMDDDFMLTCHHEAGHAVAAVMRGHELRALTVEATEEFRGFTGYRGRPVDDAFIGWAGPWAQGRALWRGDAGGDSLTLDAVDEEGIEFRDYISAAFLTGGDGDLHAVDRYVDELSGLGLDLPSPEATWCRELELVWPVILGVAARLLHGESITHQMVEEALEQHLAARFAPEAGG